MTSLRQSENNFHFIFLQKLIICMLEIILAKFEVILASETPSFIPVLVQMYFFLTFKRCSSAMDTFISAKSPIIPLVTVWWCSKLPPDRSIIHHVWEGLSVSEGGNFGCSVMHVSHFRIEWDFTTALGGIRYLPLFRTWHPANLRIFV